MVYSESHESTAGNVNLLVLSSLCPSSPELYIYMLQDNGYKQNMKEKYIARHQMWKDGKCEDIEAIMVADRCGAFDA